MTSQQLRATNQQNAPGSTSALEDLLSTPTDEVFDMFANMDGQLVMLGVGGKMGPTMARMAQRAITVSGSSMTLVAVSRFSNQAVRDKLESWGVRTHVCDLLDPPSVAALPDATHVLNLSGF